MKPTPLISLQLAAKRALDVGVSTALLFILSPVMVVIAAAVRASSPGEIVFKQRRIGKDGRPFTLYKFRTMLADCPSSHVFSYKDDPRVTRAGRVLRKTSLDELPQLFNILKGEMSFVGPRPDLPRHVEKYSNVQRERLRMRPGITGWAQVNGRNHIPWDERIKLDVEYVRHWSLLRDFVTVYRTISVVLTAQGVERPRTPVSGGADRPTTRDVA